MINHDHTSVSRNHTILRIHLADAHSARTSGLDNGDLVALHGQYHTLHAHDHGNPVDPRLVAVIEDELSHAGQAFGVRRPVAEQIAARVWAWLAEGDPA